MQQIGRYLVIRELGRGAMGVVFEAHDPLIGRTVAVKTIRLDVVGNPSETDQLQERLFREARSAGTLSHPGIVVIHDLGRHEKLAYIAMERVDGPTLEQILAMGRPGPAETLNILRQTAAALDHAHENGVVHRDIKPGNLMLHKGATWKITDFGIAKITTTQQLTQTGMVLGTPSYMSPEHISAQPVDGRTDQFSLAVIAFELLTGQKPFQADTLAGLVHQIVYAERPSAKSIRPDLPDAADAVLKRGLAKEAADRYPSCTAFVDALEKCLQAVPARLRVTADTFCKVCGATLAEGQTQCSFCARPLGPDTNFEKAFGIPPERRPVQAIEKPPEPVSSPPPAPPTAVSNDVPAYEALSRPETRIRPSVAPSSLIGAVAGAIVTIAAITSLVVFLGKRSSVGPIAERNVPTDVSTPPQPAATPEQEPAAPHPAVKVPLHSKAPGPAVEVFRRVEADPVARPPVAKQADNPDKSPVRSVAPVPSVTRIDPAVEAQMAYSTNDFARLRVLAEAGNAFAQNDLGFMYQGAQGVPKDDVQAVAWYRKSAEVGNASGQNNLAFMYQNGRGLPKDYVQALALYRKAADQGLAAAQDNLGDMYRTGQGVPKDDEQAVAWYRFAADKGLAVAQYNLGDMYRTGSGVPMDATQAIAWYRKAADQGYAAAQNDLGSMYQRGQGVQRNDAEAVAWFRKAADRGLADAQNWLGYMYEYGFGVPKDQTEAIDWYRKAATQGLQAARDNLKRLNIDQPVAKSAGGAEARAFKTPRRLAAADPVEEARKAFAAQDYARVRALAQGGNALAQYYMGNEYENGWGVPKDQEQAINWYREAAKQGSQPGKDALKRLNVDQ